MATEIRVTAKSNRFSFDGETGFLVLAGTPGTIGAMTLHDTGKKEGAIFPILRQTLTVFWDHALSQIPTNDEPTETTQDFSESEVDPAEVEYLAATDNSQ